MWKALSVFCLLVVVFFYPLAFVQADGRVILQVLVSAVVTFITITMWEITKEAFKK